MGEILEALRRAEEERKSERATTRPSPLPAREPSYPPIPARDPEAAPPERGAAPEPSPRRPMLAEVERPRPERPVPGPAYRVLLPREKTGDWRSRSVLIDGTGPIAESFRQAAVKLRAALEARGARSVVVTSAVRGEGKTTTSCNLAFAMASVLGGARVALVDFDLRRPRVASALAVAPRVGVESVLAGDAEVDAACVATDLPALDLYLVAERRPDPHELIAGPGLAHVLDALEARYELVIIDSPPALLVPDTALVLSRVPTYLAVARSGVTRVAAFRAMLDALPPGRLAGSFLNEAPLGHGATDYGYYEPDDADEESAEEGRSWRWKRRKTSKP